jgi:hypothetical protein
MRKTDEKMQTVHSWKREKPPSRRRDRKPLAAASNNHSPVITVPAERETQVA